MRGNWLEDDDPSELSRHALAPVPADADPAPHPRGTRRAARHAAMLAESGARAIAPVPPLDEFRDEDFVVGSPRTARTEELDAIGAVDRDPAAPPPWALGVILAGAVAALGVLIAGFATGNGETKVAGVVMIVLCGISAAVIKRVTADTHHGEYMLLIAGLSTKLLASLLRYWIAFSGALYSRSDAKTYDDDGRRIATEFISHGHLPPYRSFTGSNFLRVLTGGLYSVIPPSTLAAFFVFGWFSFWGYVMFWRAMRRIVVPPQDRRYLILLMFMPSLAYWPSSLGKESVVIFALGLASLGYARSCTGSPLSGGAYTLSGVALCAMVRPHVAIVVVVGIAAATVFQKRTQGTIVNALLTGVLLLPAGAFALSQASAYFNGDVTSSAGVSSQLDAASKRTAQGGSQCLDCEAVSPANPVQFPYAAMTVILRPFPWESPSIQEFTTSIEAAFVGLLLIKNFRKAINQIRRDNPYAIFAFVNLVVFIVLFSNFNNFGILARQRTQIAPFLFLFLALPDRPLRKRRTSADRAWDEFEREPLATR